MVGVTVRLEVEREMEWWRPLVQGLACLPHLLWTGILVGASVFVAFVIGIAVLVTGRVPARLGAFVVLSLRERVRTFSYFWLLRRDHPPFATTLTAVDPGDDPRTEVTVVVPDQLPRWSILRGILILPHLVVLVPIAVVIDLGYPVLAVWCAIRRGWPEGFERFLLRVERYVGAVTAYALLVTDEAPRFGLGAYEPTPAALTAAPA